MSPAIRTTTVITTIIAASDPADILPPLIILPADVLELEAGLDVVCDLTVEVVVLVLGDVLGLVPLEV